METTYKVDVTEMDIARGCHGNAYSCMIACAIERQEYNNPDFDMAAIYPHADFRGVMSLRFKSGKILRAHLPKDANKKALDFDKQLNVQPFCFEVELA